VARVLQSTEIPDLPETTTLISNPALLVNGNVTLAGSARIQGTRGNVHANGNVYGNGNPAVTGDITATGTVDDSLHPGGMKAGNMPGITIPAIKAQDYRNLADFVLKADGTVKLADGTTACAANGSVPPKCPSGWSYSGGTWSSSGAMPSSATYYVEGNVTMKGTGNSPVTALSVIAEGSIELTGNGKFKPENGAGIQFVTNGDFSILGTVDADDTTDFDGQIMVREQLKFQGNAEFQGRVMVENRDGATNGCPVGGPYTNGCRRGSSILTDNEVSGNMTLTYNGHLGDIVTTIVIPAGASTYTNNISGWLEQ
jgi:cytoskeletal protein CcmA (bactofilin family)